MKRKIGGFLASAILCAFNANAATECGLTDPHITGYGDVYSVGINDAGQIVGWRWRKPSAGGGRQGFIWSNGKLTILPDSGGHTLLTAAINQRGQVTGMARRADGSFHGFLWDGSRKIGIETLGGRDSRGFGLNNHGHVVGYSRTAFERDHAFLWKDGILTDLAEILGTENSAAYAINDAGQIIGGDSIGAFLMDPDGTVQYLPEFSIAHDINEAGQVVGIGYAGALLWSNGQTTHLGALPGAFNGTNSEAYALNETRQVAGYSYAPSRRPAVRWNKGVIQDLGGVAATGMGINSFGHITGVTMAKTGFLRPFIWKKKC